GVDSAICAIDRISKIIEQQAVVDKLTNSFAVASGKVSITEVTIEKDWNGVGKKLKEISLSRKIIVGCILRGDDTMIPYGDTEILAGDTLILISEQGQEEKAIKVFGTN
ncbi:MAG: TrkA family potassium uptake protein, partial [Clostridiales bacterium]|nr:TrkA family potassium uptake protein [Clostridiales bacterium]